MSYQTVRLKPILLVITASPTAGRAWNLVVSQHLLNKEMPTKRCTPFSVELCEFHRWRLVQQLCPLTSFIICVLVHSGCCSRIPQSRWLKQQTVISYSSGGWTSEIRVDSWCGLSSRYVLTWSNLAGGGWIGVSIILMFLLLFIRPLISSWDLHPRGLI